MFLYVYQIRKGVVTSGALFTFWFLQAILGVITFRSVLKTNYVIGEEQLTPFTDYTLAYPVTVALFFLVCWAEPKPKYVNMDGKYQKHFKNIYLKYSSDFYRWYSELDPGEVRVLFVTDLVLLVWWYILDWMEKVVAWKGHLEFDEGEQVGS